MSSAPPPTKPLPSFPYDIWIQIAHCIPPANLEGLFSVNSALFHLAMEQRYRQISFAYLGPKMMRLLWRLKDPNVAKRVRILHMHPHFIKELIDAESMTSETDSVFSLFARHKKLLTFRATKTHPRRRSDTLDTVVVNLMSVLRGLPNLSEYHIAWVSPNLPSYPSFLTMPLLHSPITRLSLEMTLENLERLHPMPCMRKLRELDLFLRPGHALDGTGYDMILVHVLAPFVAAHPDLKSLSLRLFEPMDISPLFSSLPLFLKLYSLSVTVPLTAPHLGDPDAFADFLNTHTHTLRQLCLRVSDLSSPVLGLIDASLARWMQTAFYAVRVESLRVLEVGMGLMPVESAQLVVRRFGALDKLILTGRSLTLEEVEGLLPRSMVKRLRIGPVVLSPQMMDVFADCILDLERLEVVGTDVVPCDGDSVIPDYEHGGQDDSQVAKFFDVMARRTYSAWALRTLELDGRGRCLDERDVWRACVPALKEIIL